MAKVPSNKGETDHKLRRLPGTTENQIPMISLRILKANAKPLLTTPITHTNPCQKADYGAASEDN
jgi:hypothetical protein